MISHAKLAEYGRLLAQIGAMMVELERLRAENAQLKAVLVLRAAKATDVSQKT